MTTSCPVCKSINCQIIFESEDENLARYGLLKNEGSVPFAPGLNQSIFYCEKCSFAWNTKFDYSKVKYDSDQIIEAGYFSKRYIDYQKSSAVFLKKLMGFTPETIVEIGAGAGIFIKEFEAKRKIAIEPSDECRQIDGSIEVYNEYFTENRFNFPADIIVLRQVLEHIKDPVEFLKTIQSSFDKLDNFYLYLEVPNSTLTFRFGRFYDYYYEHCNYFSINTFKYLADKMNMEIVNLSTEMDGELISVLMSKEKLNFNDIKNSIDINRSEILNELKKKILGGKKIIAWGASGNGVQILNNLKINKSIVPYVIDSDTSKQGRFIPGTFQKIISPEEAAIYEPDVVIVLTQFHKAEIGIQSARYFNNAQVWFLN